MDVAFSLGSALMGFECIIHRKTGLFSAVHPIGFSASTTIMVFHPVPSYIISLLPIYFSLGDSLPPSQAVYTSYLRADRTCKMMPGPRAHGCITALLEAELTQVTIPFPSSAASDSPIPFSSGPVKSVCGYCYSCPG